MLFAKASSLLLGGALPGTLRKVRGVVLADFDKDGRLDVAAVDASNNIGNSDKLQVWIQSTVAGVFKPAVGYAISGQYGYVRERREDAQFLGAGKTCP